ncbi:hypothetical protein FQA39_LY06088 [Lamprigera yunnana]|nr:hypothetical protein FQA39_LY06088 [Lamprigera yunnana]
MTTLCSDFGQIEHAAISLMVESALNDNVSQQTIHIQCGIGYDLEGPPKIQCVNGQWEHTVQPRCVSRCQPPPYISNGRYQIEGNQSDDGMYKKGILAIYSCKKGYQLTPPESQYRVCEKGIWTGANATCVMTEKILGCKPPEDILHGYFVNEKTFDIEGVYSIGQRLHFSCKSGYYLIGTQLQQCLDDGTWSPKLSPQCFPDTGPYTGPDISDGGSGALALSYEMAGQTINDRLLAAKYSLAGQGLAKSVCKATTEELLGPKKKHLDYLVHCTNEPNVSIPHMANLLIERSQNTSWVVVYKALITTHHLMCYGNERFTQYLASSNTSFQLSNFVDKTGVQSAVGARTGYDMSPFIRRYARYINEKALSYRAVAFDFCKVKRGKEEGTLRTMNSEHLLKTLPILQNQLDALLEFDCTANDLTNGVINVCFMLLFRDLIRLFACYNDGIINLLEKYFEMNKKQCRDALDLYKKFLIRMDRVGEFLKVAENIGIDKGDIPDLTKAPNSLLDALEQHLASLEGNTPTQTVSNQKNLKTGVSALSNTSNAFGSAVSNTQIDETLKQAAVAEEEAALSKYKASVNSPTASSTNPFLSSPTKTEPILDLFGSDIVGTQPASIQPSKAIDDLLQLGNPFTDMFSAPPSGPNATTTDFFGNSTVTTSMAQPTNMWSNGFTAQPSPGVFSGGNLSTMFNTNEPSVFDPIASVQQCVPQQQPPPVQPTRPPQQQKLLTGDLESSLASLAENLTIDSGRNAPMQWNSPKNAAKPAGTGWQPQPIATSTAPNYKPMGQPMNSGLPMQYSMGMQQQMMGSPKINNTTQPTKQEDFVNVEALFTNYLPVFFLQKLMQLFLNCIIKFYVIVGNDYTTEDYPCSSAPTVPHALTSVIQGFQSLETALPGTEVEIRCIPKYRNLRNPCQTTRLRCTNGRWVGILPNCVLARECSSPPVVAHGSPFDVNTDINRIPYPINVQISYQCLPGFELQGNYILTCTTGGCWTPATPPVCKLNSHYFLEVNGGGPMLISLATGAGVLLLLLVIWLAIVCRRRKPLSRAVPLSPPVPRPDLADHAALLHHPDRLALIAFADGIQVGQSVLPTYEEAVRDRGPGFVSSRLSRPHWPSLAHRRNRNSPDIVHVTRQGSL